MYMFDYHRVNGPFWPLELQNQRFYKIHRKFYQFWVVCFAFHVEPMFKNGFLLHFAFIISRILQYICNCTLKNGSPWVLLAIISSFCGQECMDCLESCGIRATGKQMPGVPAVELALSS